MNFSTFFKRSNSAPVARERLQILLAHERSPLGRSDLIASLKEEILAAISRHVALDPDKVQVKMDRGDAVSMLEIDVEIPNGVTALAANS
ncbi:MAG: cell division topological specificity factor MinE [Xanthobacteraceae bacterium]